MKQAKPVRVLDKGAAFKFVVLLGVVSLFGDMTYEGARSITGPYLSLLGASAAVVGLVAGFGELIGFGLRLFSGYISDKTGRYWTITIAGYVVNLLAVPALALAGSWQFAALLMILERTGKAIRAPSRDALLSYATKQTGHGKGFGLHEALDQIGALTGPLIVALVMWYRAGNGKEDYATAFAFLLIPALLAIGLVLIARFLYPRLTDLDAALPTPDPTGWKRTFWLYLGGVGLVAAGYADFPLLAYHFEKADVLSGNIIPLVYSLAMGVDAVAALLFGRLFDKSGIQALVISTLLSAGFAPLAFTGSPVLVIAGAVLWGVGMGAQESIMRAAVAKLVPIERRGTAFGVFNTGYGLCWFAGSALMGFMYDISIPLLVTFSVAVQLVAIFFFVVASKD